MASNAQVFIYIVSPFLSRVHRFTDSVWKTNLYTINTQKEPIWMFTYWNDTCFPIQMGLCDEIIAIVMLYASFQIDSYSCKQCSRACNTHKMCEKFDSNLKCEFWICWTLSARQMRVNCNDTNDFHRVSGKRFIISHVLFQKALFHEAWFAFSGPYRASLIRSNMNAEIVIHKIKLLWVQILLLMSTVWSISISEWIKQEKKCAFYHFVDSNELSRKKINLQKNVNVR